MGPPVISLVARSGTGKTTLLEKLIVELKSRGYQVGAVKHDAHKFNIDHEGKDSWRMTRAGADTMLVTSSSQVAMVKQFQPGDETTLPELIKAYCAGMDIVLTEGYRRSTIPRIEVHRRELGRPLLCRGEEHDPSLLAIASDASPDVDVPVFAISDTTGICDFIVERFLP